MKKALIVGGSNGIGLAIAMTLVKSGYEVSVLDMVAPDVQALGKVSFEHFDLTDDDYSVFDKYSDIDILMITAGFGRLALFQDIDEELIARYFHVNTIPAMRIIKRFYGRLLSPSPFHLGVMVSIAGFMSSPFFSVYGATKAALKIFIESINVELDKNGSPNKILNVSPGAIQGTHFNGGTNNHLELLMPLAGEIVRSLMAGEDLLIPNYDEIYAEVLERYHRDFRAEGLRSYDYKVNSGRISKH